MPDAPPVFSEHPIPATERASTVLRTSGFVIQATSSSPALCRRMPTVAHAPLAGSRQAAQFVNNVLLPTAPSGSVWCPALLPPTHHALPASPVHRGPPVDPTLATSAPPSLQSVAQASIPRAAPRSKIPSVKFAPMESSQIMARHASRGPLKRVHSDRASFRAPIW